MSGAGRVATPALARRHESIAASDAAPTLPGLAGRPQGMTAPSPTWSIAGVEFYVGDCRELLPALIPRADAICTDPPYGIGDTRHGTLRGSRGLRSLRVSGYDGYPVTAIPGDETTPELPIELLIFPALADVPRQHPLYHPREAREEHGRTLPATG